MNFHVDELPENRLQSKVRGKKPQNNILSC